MKKSNDHGKALHDLLKKLPAADPPELPEADDPLAVFVFSFLLWESTTDKAIAAFRRLLENSVDFNDLRVSMPHEVAETIGVRYPRAEERAQRMRAALRDIYLREHEVSLQRVSAEGKREVRKYLESLDGIVPFVVGRTLLMGYDAHAIPVDEQLRQKLIAGDLADPELDAAELSAWMSRQIKAGEAVAAHLALQAWAETADGKSGGRKSKSSGRVSRTGEGRNSKKSDPTAPSPSRKKTAGSGAS